MSFSELNCVFSILCNCKWKSTYTGLFTTHRPIHCSLQMWSCVFVNFCFACIFNGDGLFYHKPFLLCNMQMHIKHVPKMLHFFNRSTWVLAVDQEHRSKYLLRVNSLHAIILSILSFFFWMEEFVAYRFAFEVLESMVTKRPWVGVFVSAMGWNRLNAVDSLDLMMNFLVWNLISVLPLAFQRMDQLNMMLKRVSLFRQMDEQSKTYTRAPAKLNYTIYGA